MARKKGTIPYSGNFEVKIAEPLDARGKVATKAALIDPETWRSSDGLIYTYVGMAPSVYADTPDNNGIYILIAENYKIATNWKAAGTIPEKATASLDGLLSKEDFAKLVTLNADLAGKLSSNGDGSELTDIVAGQISATIYGDVQTAIDTLTVVVNGKATSAQGTKADNAAPQSTTYTKAEINAKLTHSYTLDFQNTVTILQDWNMDGAIRITDIKTDNVATLTKGVTTIEFPLIEPININDNELLTWTITRTTTGLATSVGIKYIKL